MLIAGDLGFAIVKEERRLLFYNRRLLPFRHLSYLLGVLTACCLLGVVVMIHLRPSGWQTQAFILLVPGLLLLGALLASIRQYVIRRRCSLENLQPRYIADLERGELLTAKGDVMTSLAEVRVRIKTAGDSYCSDELGPRYNKVILQWGRKRSIAVLKSEDDELLRQARAALLAAGCGSRN